MNYWNPLAPACEVRCEPARVPMRRSRNPLAPACEVRSTAHVHDEAPLLNPLAPACEVRFQDDLAIITTNNESTRARVRGAIARGGEAIVRVLESTRARVRGAMRCYSGAGAR